MENKCIKCRNNKVTVVDPNVFNDEYVSSKNIPVDLTDLNISVVLKTRKNPRTVISSENGGADVKSVYPISINFIEGSKISGQKILTTKYTDLTTVFEKGVVNDETLGITNIDIDFNASMAPMVTIDFVDVRGSSIFQNDEQISGVGNGNKYGTLFQLPYPIFELEVKGYYGKTVTYCLHMIKFNSRFNSQTGNFEIKCQFIGYTYAMLSDMIIGYLKAISCTECGSTKYDDLNKKRTNKIISLNDLMIKINNINDGVTKLSASSPSATDLGNITEARDLLTAIKADMYNLGFDIEIEKNNAKTDYKFIACEDKGFTENQNTLIASYKTNVKKNIDTLNQKGLLNKDLSVDFFTDISTVTEYSNNGGSGIVTNVSLNDLEVGKGRSDLSTGYKDALSSYLKNNYKGNGVDLKYKVVNMNSKYKEISNAEADLNEKEKNSKEKYAQELKKLFRTELGFDPTIRNIIEIFTVAIEIFLECIYDVSTSAETKKERKTTLEKKFKTSKNSTDIKPEYVNKSTTYYPWPTYREKDSTTNTFVERYLGSINLDNPNNVPEITFIDDLYRAFIKCEKVAQEQMAASEAELYSWIPVNVFDSSLIQTLQPYGRDKDYYLRKENLYKTLLVRGVTFLGMSNEELLLTPEEIETMGKIEGQALMLSNKQGLIPSSVLRTLANENNADVITTKVPVNGTNRRIVITDTPYINYELLTNNTTEVLQISNYSDTDWDLGKFNNENYLVGKRNTQTDSTKINYFLTNYSNSTAGLKQVDGGEYVKIVYPEKYNTNNLASSDLIGTTTTLKLDKLMNKVITNAAEAGYNTFGGSDGTYGVFEARKIDYSVLNSSLGEQKSSLIFYGEKLRKGGGLANKRPFGAKTVYDFDDNESNINTIDISKPSLIPNKNVSREKSSDDYAPSVEPKTLHENLGLNLTLLSTDNTNVTYPYIEQSFGKIEGSGRDTQYRSGLYDREGFSLFGSKFYYLQSFSTVKNEDNKNVNCAEYSKALLFLNTLPFNQNGIGVGRLYENYGDALDYGQLPEILHMFDVKGGIVHAPRLWCAYVGGLLWRDSYLKAKTIIDDDGNEIIVGGGSGNEDPITWKVDVSVTFNDVGIKQPKKTDYFPTVSEYLPKKVGDLLNRLPTQVKIEFKRIFFEFVNGKTRNGANVNNSWLNIKNKLEIWDDYTDNSGPNFCTKFNSVNNLNDKLNYNEISNFLTPSVRENYKIITRYKQPSSNQIPLLYQSFLPLLYQSFFLELRDDSPAVNDLLIYLKEDCMILNSTYRVWVEVSNTKSSVNLGPLSDGHSNILVKEDNLKKYLDGIKSVLKDNLTDLSETTEDKKLKEQIFGSSNEDTIKLSLYTTCKNVYDKWVAGSLSKEKIIFKCNSARLPGDYDLAEKYKNGLPTLIDSFRFISRSFKDIGDKLYVNPIPINNYLKESPNTSSYDAISHLLDSNKFIFESLPTFIDFRDETNVKAIFEPTPVYSDAVKQGTCGPSFVCVYAGQTSKHLDYWDSEYENDGFDFSCDKVGGQLMSEKLPDDFSEDIGGGNEPIAVFSVTYGQQNQNVFKDIVLDQSEFTETDESIQIQDEISKNGSETSRSLIGQNLYNVYSVRSYTAEVEMLGNPMIQPMMYFQLENIPMFHGAYMITRVRHNIKPNHMTTTFTGVRTRYAETPLITSYDMYMSLANDLKASSSGGNGGGTTTSGNWVEQYHSKLTNNPPNSSTIDASFISTPNKITLRGKEEYANWDSGGLQECTETGNLLIDKYNLTTGFNLSCKQAWSALFSSYMLLAGDSKFPTSTVHKSYITEGMKGTEGYEVFALSAGLKIKPAVGDLFCYYSHCDVVYKIENNKATLIGGNLTQSVQSFDITLDNGYVTDSTNLKPYGGKYRLVMKKTNNKYYENQNMLNSSSSIVENTGDGSAESNKNTKTSGANPNSAQLYTKNFFKTQGLTKSQVAGIMGNIHHETGGTWDPLATNKRDSNGYPSVGLIQWNGKFTPKGGSYDKEKIFDTIGRTVETQLNYLVSKYGFYKDWVNLDSSYGTKKYANSAAYEFARVVERCDKCTKGYDKYKGSYQVPRSQYANDFFKRFDDSTDPLYW